MMLDNTPHERGRRLAEVLRLATLGAVSSRTIQTRLGGCERSAQRYLRELTDRGLLTRERDGNLSRYRLTDVGRDRLAA